MGITGEEMMGNGIRQVEETSSEDYEDFSLCSTEFIVVQERNEMI